MYSLVIRTAKNSMAFRILKGKELSVARRAIRRRTA